MADFLPPCPVFPAEQIRIFLFLHLYGFRAIGQGSGARREEKTERFRKPRVPGVPGKRGRNGNPHCKKRRQNMPFHRVSSFPRLRIPPVLKKGQRLPACPGKGVSRPHFPLDGCPKDRFASPAHGRVLLHTHHGGPLLRF